MPIIGERVKKQKKPSPFFKFNQSTKSACAKKKKWVIIFFFIAQKHAFCGS